MTIKPESIEKINKAFIEIGKAAETLATSISNAVNALESVSASIQSFRETIETVKHTDSASASDSNDICSLPTKEFASSAIDGMIAGLNRPAPDDMRQAINRLIQNIQSQCAEEGKIEIKLDGIYLNGVNCTDWMQYAAEGGKLSLPEYVKQHKYKEKGELGNE